MPSASGAIELQALTSFRVKVGMTRKQTTLEVTTASDEEPVARMSKVGPLRKRAAYELFTGPGLRTVAGTLSASGALDADGMPLGVVNLSGAAVPDADIHPLSGGHVGYALTNPTKWRFIQPGLPPLKGEAMDVATRLLYNPVSDAAGNIGLSTWMPDYVVPLTFRYSAPECDGFTVTLTSRKAQLDVTVHDPAIDRRLILACVAALTLLVMQHPHRDMLDALPLWRPRRKN